MQAHKAPRRMQLADDVSLLWESETTIDHQVRQMLAMEDDPESQRDIRAGYAELRPTPTRMTATVSVEVREASKIKSRLGYYAGLEHAFGIEAGGERVPARILGDHGTPEATTAVTYLAFDLPEAQRKDAWLVVDHPRLQVRAPLPPL